jgi:hypothetical protein
MPRKLNRRRAIYGVLAVALIALAIPVFALAGSSSVTVPLRYHVNSCSPPAKKKSDGSVTFTRDKAGNLTVTIDVHGGDPTPQSYVYIYLYYDGCSYWDSGWTYKIDSSGNAHKVFTVPGTTGYNDWMIFAYNTSSGYYDSSDTAHLA